VEREHALVGHLVKEAKLSEKHLPSENIFENLPTFAGLGKKIDLGKFHESDRWAAQFETANDGKLSVRVGSNSSVVVTFFFVNPAFSNLQNYLLVEITTRHQSFFHGACEGSFFTLAFLMLLIVTDCDRQRVCHAHRSNCCFFISYGLF
jgi:hypothetical protein